jgi:formamidopyrimidine-DNA glycosylase
MPELPEVETVRRGLERALVGRRLRDARATVPTLRTPIDLPALRRTVRDRRVLAVRRRAKYLLVDLDGGKALLVHLGMTGTLRVAPPAEPPEKHDRVLVELADGATLRLHDPRRFGEIQPLTLAPDAWPERLAHLGPEPLGADFTPAYLKARCRKRRIPVKSLLMDQSVVVGIGNIYASEALWRARIRPGRRAARLTRRECAAVVREARGVLREAIEHGGTTILDFAGVQREAGAYVRKLRVYGREGEPCRRRGCDGTIKRIVQSGRSTFYCPACQG